MIFKTCVLIYSASKMWLLGRLLPLFLGSHIPDGDEHWVCYLLLLRVLVLSTSFEVADDTVSLLTKIVQDYLQFFRELYPGRIVPKVHYLLHLPQQMKRWVDSFPVCIVGV